MRYIIERDKILTVIDIAVASFEKFPPKGFNHHLDHIIQTYLSFKESILNSELQYQNLSSLKYIQTDVFAYFNESENETTAFFWSEIKKQDLGYKKNDKLSQIIKRGKIKSKIEYDFIQDIFVTIQQEKRIDENEMHLINRMLTEFEKKYSYK